MKRFVLLIIFALCGLVSFAQFSLRISQMKTDTLPPYGRVFVKEVLPNDRIEISTAHVEMASFEADILNGSDKDGTFYLFIEVTDTIGGTDIGACWSECNNPWNFDFTPLLLESGIVKPFSVDYWAPGVSSTGMWCEGRALVKVMIVNVEDANDCTTFWVYFNPNPTSVSEQTSVLVSQKIYPNPASSILNISYQLNKQCNNVKVSLYNMLGMTIAEKYTNEKESTILFDAALLPQGVYFCTVKVGEAVIATKKIIISH